MKSEVYRRGMRLNEHGRGPGGGGHLRSEHHRAVRHKQYGSRLDRSAHNSTLDFVDHRHRPFGNFDEPIDEVFGDLASLVAFPM